MVAKANAQQAGLARAGQGRGYAGHVHVNAARIWRKSETGHAMKHDEKLKVDGKDLIHEDLRQHCLFESV